MKARAELRCEIVGVEYELGSKNKAVLVLRLPGQKRTPVYLPITLKDAKKFPHDRRARGRVLVEAL